MAILSRPLLRAQQRFDLEDLNALLSAARTDANYYTKRFLAEKSYIVRGFRFDETQIGTSKTAKLYYDNALLFNGDSTGDASWYTVADSEYSIDLGYGVGLLQSGRNYVELQIKSTSGTPLQRAFWDPSANSGQGVEFVRTVETVTDLELGFVINQTGFTVGGGDKIPLAIIDHDGTFVTGIRDKRSMFFRLASPTDLDRNFTWDRTEAPTVITLSSITGTFVVGNSVLVGSSTGIISEVGLDYISVYSLSGDGFSKGSAVTSGAASGVITKYSEKFVGSDKDIHTFKDALDALMTEIKVIKGTRFWWELGGALSLPTLLNYVNSCLVPVTTTSHFKWTGTELIISDDKTVGLADSDPIAAIRIPGKVGEMILTRQDGKGGSIPLAIADQEVLYVKMPAAYSSIDFSDLNTGSGSFQTASRGSFVPTDLKYIIAYREGTTLIIPGSGELKPGEEVDIGNGISKETLAFIGAESETDSAPNYTTTPSSDLSNEFTSNNSLTQAISINAANINDIARGILRPYDEALYIITDIPDNTHEEQGPVTIGSDVFLPTDSRDGDAIRKYKVGSGSLFVFLNGQHLTLTEDYEEVGAVGTLSNKVRFTQELVVGDIIDFRLINPQYIGTAGLDQPLFVNLITGQNGSGIGVGHIYNRVSSLFAERLQVYRNGVNLFRGTAGTADQRYSEDSNASILLELPAEPSDVFSMVNMEGPDAMVQIQSMLTGVTTLTIPTYTMGNQSLKIYRNGVLMSNDPMTPMESKYTEATINTVTLAEASLAADVFKIVIGNAPSSYSWQTGITVANLTVPNVGASPQRLMVFKNGALLINSSSLGTAAERYTMSGATTVVLGEDAINSDFFAIYLM